MSKMSQTNLHASVVRDLSTGTLFCILPSSAYFVTRSTSFVATDHRFNIALLLGLYINTGNCKLQHPAVTGLTYLQSTDAVDVQDSIQVVISCIALKMRSRSSRIVDKFTVNWSWKRSC